MRGTQQASKAEAVVVTCLTLQSCMGSQVSSQLGTGGTLRSCCLTCLSYPDLNSTTSCTGRISLLKSMVYVFKTTQGKALIDIALCMVVMHAAAVQLARKDYFGCFGVVDVAFEATCNPSLLDNTGVEDLPYCFDRACPRSLGLVHRQHQRPFMMLPQPRYAREYRQHTMGCSSRKLQALVQTANPSVYKFLELTLIVHAKSMHEAKTAAVGLKQANRLLRRHMDLVQVKWKAYTKRADSSR